MEGLDRLTIEENPLSCDIDVPVKLGKHRFMVVPHPRREGRRGPRAVDIRSRCFLSSPPGRRERGFEVLPHCI